MGLAMHHVYTMCGTGTRESRRRPRKGESRFFGFLLGKHEGGPPTESEIRKAKGYPNIFPLKRPGAYDADPSQLLNPRMPAVLHAAMPPNLLPKVRLIASLREPGSRMLSWYNHRMSWGLRGGHWCSGHASKGQQSARHFAADAQCEVTKSAHDGTIRQPTMNFERGTPLATDHSCPYQRTNPYNVSPFNLRIVLAPSYR